MPQRVQTIRLNGRGRATAWYLRTARHQARVMLGGCVEVFSAYLQLRRGNSFWMGPTRCAD